MRFIQLTLFVSGFASVASQTLKYKVNPAIAIAVLENPTFRHSNSGTGLKLCESDCDEDTDCVQGLRCADKWKSALKKIGLDERAANCYSSNKAAFSTTGDVFEVCFDPKILNSGGAGGDPHFRTYDGTKYTYHGECDLVMAHSQLDDQNELNLHARTKLIDNSWSLISNVAVKLGDDTFEVDNDEVAHYFNGDKNEEFPILLSGKYEVTSQEQMITSPDETGVESTTKEITYTIDLAGKGSITITNYRSMLSVRVDSYLHDTYGMLGHRTMDGLVGRDGKTIVVENEMGTQWQVRDTEPMLFHELGSGPQYPESCILPTVGVASQRRRLRQSNISLDAAETACKNVDDSMKSFCIDDVIRSGDVSMAHVYTASAW